MIFDQIINTFISNEKIGDISKWVLQTENGLIGTLDLNQIFYCEASRGYDLYLYTSGVFSGWNVNYVLTTFVSNPDMYYISVHGVNKFTSEQYECSFSFLSNWTEEQYFQQSLLDDICLELTTLKYLQKFFQKLIVNLHNSEGMKIL